MDLIFMNSQKEDVGVLKDYTFDLAFGTDENDFECVVSAASHCCEAGFFLYYEGSEYGGIVDSIEVNTEAEEVKYTGRTWHGILDSKILEPDAGEDYLIVEGEANAVLAFLIDRMGLPTLFKASEEDSGVQINYQMNRYIRGYEAIRKLLKASGMKLNMVFKMGFVELSASPIIDYSKDERFDTDQISFVIKKNFKPLNHVICLGKGELKDREVIHVYSDSSGKICDEQVLTGIDEVCKVYDCSNAESSEELRQGGIDLILESWNSDEVNFGFDLEGETYDVGDIVGAVEASTGIEVAADITKKIVSIKDNTTIISYKVGE